MTHFFKILPLLALCPPVFGQNQAPRIENFQTDVNWTTHTLTLTFDALDAENDPLDIALGFSNNGGAFYNPAVLHLPTGDLGFPIAPGAAKKITCDISSLVGMTGKFSVRIVADDRQPFDVQALVNQVDSNRLRENLRFVQGIRHRTAGVAKLQAVRDSMERTFRGLGLRTEIQQWNALSTTAKNIIGTAPGISAAEKVVVLDAHYDSVANAPGADDNGSGTVGVLEAARVLSQFPSKKSLRFIGFDLEEAGLLGSIKYVQSGIPAGEQIEGVFNFEMIGYYTEKPGTQKIPAGFDILFFDAYNQVAMDDFRGNFVLNVGNTNSQSMVTLFKNSAAQYVPGLKVVNIVAPGNSQLAPDLRRSDHTPFWEAGKKALMLTDGSEFRNNAYHMASDTMGSLNFTFMSNVVKATVAAAAQLAEIQHAAQAVLDFEIPVGTENPGRDACGWSYIFDQRYPQEIRLIFKSCSAASVDFELLDEKGAVLLARPIALPGSGGETEIPVFLQKNLPRGMYFIRISHAGGSRTQKFMHIGQ